MLDGWIETLVAGVPVNTEHRENTREISAPGERYKYTSSLYNKQSS